MRRALIIGLSLLIMLTVGLVVLLASVGPGGGNAADASSCGSGAMPISKIPDLDARQTRNAQTIIQVGVTLKVPTFGQEVAIATSYQEAKLRNIASSAVPESESYPNDGVVSGDHDSVGTFQQRANWGTVAERMTVTIAADKFYRALLAVPGWDKLPLTVAAQRVQGSAFPDAYAQWEALARSVVGKLGGTVAPVQCSDVQTSTATGKVKIALDHALLARDTSYSFGGSCADPQSPDMSLHCDCSSLVQMAWAAAGVKLPRTSEAQYNAVPKVAGIDASNVARLAQPGMLLFYEWGEDNIPGPGHVALALGDGYLIEAPQPGEDVHIIPIYSRSFVSAGLVAG
jgi:cell wall-associated NlpC family hydrolase